MVLPIWDPVSCHLQGFFSSPCLLFLSYGPSSFSDLPLSSSPVFLAFLHKYVFSMHPILPLFSQHILLRFLASRTLMAKGQCRWACLFCSLPICHWGNIEWWSYNCYYKLLLKLPRSLSIYFQLLMQCSTWQY